MLGTRRFTRREALGLAVVTGATLLAGCSSQNGSDSSTATSVAIGDDALSILVKGYDWGPGVPEERKAELLTGRFSASGSLAKGVGLSLVKSIIESHGGQVTLSDNQPHGSVFSLQLPLHSDQQPSTTQT